MQRKSGASLKRWHQLLGLSVTWLVIQGVAIAAENDPGFQVRQQKHYALPVGLSGEEWQEVLQQIQPARLAADALVRRGGEQPKPAPSEGRQQGGNGAVLQTDYLKMFNPGASDQAGYSLDLSGDVLVVGAPYEDSNGLGSDGSPSNDSLSNAGAAYVFRRVGGSWQQEAYLKSPNPDANDFFGWGVAVSGDTVIVSAEGEDGSGSGINPAHNNSASAAGAVYAYVFQNSTWVFQATLKPANPGANDSFGYSVDLSGETLVVGAPDEDGSVPGVNGGYSDSAVNAGAAYIFQRNAGVWTQQAYLKASNPGASDSYGYDVAISENTVIIGAYLEDSPASVVNGSQGDDNSYLDSGAAYIFVRNGASWSQQAYLKAPNVQNSDYFGASVAVSANRAVVGAYAEDGGSSGVNGDLFSNTLGSSGSAYIFERNGSNSWYFRDYLKANNPGSSDQFGRNVAISGDLVVVGADSEDGGATTVNGPDNDSASNSGASYLYALSDGTVQFLAYIKAENSDASDLFGYPVAVSGGVLAVGASSEDSSTDYPNGPDNNSLPNSGAAYIFAGASNYHPVGGTVIGLAEGNELLLRNSDGQSLLVEQNGSFRFPLQYADGLSYDVSIEELPADPLQDCFISNGAGIISGAAVSNIIIDCAFRTLSIPRSLNTVDSGMIQVPVRFSPDGASIASLAFSIDYDESCINPDADGDGELDAVAFSVPIEFSPYISFDPSDTDGEIDVSIADISAPLSVLTEGVILSIDFTTNCPATQGEARVDSDIKFSMNPAPSFGDLAAQDVEGTLSDGVVRVWAGVQGDCNVTGGVTAPDLNAIALEIFDDDGDYYVDAPDSDYFGSPLGCDSNADESINVADVVCTNRLIFGDTCEPLRAGQGLSKPEVITQVDVTADQVWLRVDLNQQQELVGAVAFSLELDQSQFDLSQFDLNRDGVPDTIQYPQGQPGVAMVHWRADGRTAVIDILLADRARNELPNGRIMNIAIPTARSPVGGLSYAEQPQPSFSNDTGAELHGLFSLGDVILQDAFETR